MSSTVNNANAPAGWSESLTRSKAEIAAGQSAPLLPILDRLRSAAERLEDAGDEAPDQRSQTARR